jgi:hypothetical protein
MVGNQDREQTFRGFATKWVRSKSFLFGRRRQVRIGRGLNPPQ